jgi:hypothetical protein
MGCISTCSPPFAIDRVVSSTGEVGDPKEMNAVSIDARGSLQVFVVLDATAVGNNDDAVDSVNGRKDVSGGVTLTFSDGSSQQIPVTCTCHYPIVTASESRVDFGLVRNPTTRTIVLRNSGRSAAPWRLECPPGVFTCRQSDSLETEGTLEAFTSHNANVTTTIAITYTPSGECREHQSMLTVCSPVHGDVTIDLCGVGTLDEKYQ